MFASWLVGQQPLWEKKHAVAAAAVAAAAVTKSAVAAAVALTPVLVGERILCEYIRTQHGFWDPGCTAGSRVQVLGPWVRVYLQRVRSPPEELWRVQHAAQQVGACRVVRKGVGCLAAGQVLQRWRGPPRPPPCHHHLTAGLHQSVGLAAAGLRVRHKREGLRGQWRRQRLRG